MYLVERSEHHDCVDLICSHLPVDPAVRALLLKFLPHKLKSHLPRFSAWRDQIDADLIALAELKSGNPADLPLVVYLQNVVRRLEDETAKAVIGALIDRVQERAIEEAVRNGDDVDGMQLLPRSRSYRLPQPREVLADRYELISRIAGGGYAEVWIARDKRASRQAPVAIKVLRPALAADPSALRSFLSGAEKMRDLAHPQIVRVLDGPKHDPSPWFAMEYVPGNNLSVAVARDEMSLTEKLEALLDAAVGIMYAHGENLIHGDIKPENILWAPDSGAIVADFDLCKVEGRLEGRTRTATDLPGSILYCPPELWTHGKRTREGDVYSFACTVLFALRGRTHTRDDCANPRLMVDGVQLTVGIEDALVDALQRDENRRPPSVLAIKEALCAWLAIPEERWAEEFALTEERRARTILYEATTVVGALAAQARFVAESYFERVVDHPSGEPVALRGVRQQIRSYSVEQHVEFRMRTQVGGTIENRYAYLAALSLQVVGIAAFSGQVVPSIVLADIAPIVVEDWNNSAALVAKIRESTGDSIHGMPSHRGHGEWFSCLAAVYLFSRANLGLSHGGLIDEFGGIEFAMRRERALRTADLPNMRRHAELDVEKILAGAELRRPA